MKLASDPYRLFFPLGALAAVAGLAQVLPPLGTAAAPPGLRPHSVAMIEGFITLFAFGFLFTFVPRRTGTSPPAHWELALAAAGPVLATAAAALHHFMLGHLAWGVAAAVVVRFGVSRLRGRRARMPGAFVWVLAGLSAGLAGAILTLTSGALSVGDGPQAWALGRALLLQGMVPGLAIGIGAILLPQLTRGIPAPAAWAPSELRRSRALHAVAAALFLSSFPVEIYVDARAGLALRAATAMAVLVSTARIDLPPIVPGAHRKLLWLSAWLLPSGWLVAALWPRLRGPALHVGFVGGFALMTLSVSFHVALSHGGRPERTSRSPRALRAMGALVLLALATRLLVGVDPDHRDGWTITAACLLLGALAAWAAEVAPALRGGPAVSSGASQR